MIWFNIILAATAHFVAFINTAIKAHGRCTILQKSAVRAFYSAEAGNGPSERTRCAQRKFWENGVKEMNAKCWIEVLYRATKDRKLPTLRFAVKEIRETRRFDSRGIVRARHEIHRRMDKFLAKAALVLSRIYRFRVGTRLKQQRIYLASRINLLRI